MVRGEVGMVCECGDWAQATPHMGAAVRVPADGAVGSGMGYGKGHQLKCPSPGRTLRAAARALQMPQPWDLPPC